MTIQDLTKIFVLIGICLLLTGVFKPKSYGPIGDVFLAIGTLFQVLASIAVIAGLIFIVMR